MMDIETVTSGFYSNTDDSYLKLKPISKKSLLNLANFYALNKCPPVDRKIELKNARDKILVLPKIYLSNAFCNFVYNCRDEYCRPISNSQNKKDKGEIMRQIIAELWPVKDNLLDASELLKEIKEEGSTHKLHTGYNLLRQHRNFPERTTKFCSFFYSDKKRKPTDAAQLFDKMIEDLENMVAKQSQKRSLKS